MAITLELSNAVTTIDGKKQFLLVDPTWNGQGFSISYPTIYASQAHNFMEYFPAYLAHSHGNKGFRWFTRNAVTKAQAMGWDDTKNQPISLDGLNFQNTLQSLNLEWCIMSPLSVALTTSLAVDLDNITLPSFNTTTQHPPAQPGVPLTTPTTIQLATASTSITVPDDLMVLASTVDTCLSALEQSCALLPQILHRLNALDPLPSTSMGPGSTSTPSALPSTLSMPNNAVGKRD